MEASHLKQESNSQKGHKSLSPRRNSQINGVGSKFNDYGFQNKIQVLSPLHEEKVPSKNIFNVVSENGRQEDYFKKKSPLPDYEVN